MWALCLLLKTGGGPCIQKVHATEKDGPCYTEGSCHRERVGELYGDITCGGCDQEDNGDCLETEAAVAQTVVAAVEL